MADLQARHTSKITLRPRIESYNCEQVIQIGTECMRLHECMEGERDCACSVAVGETLAGVLAKSSCRPWTNPIAVSAILRDNRARHSFHSVKASRQEPEVVL